MIYLLCMMICQGLPTKNGDVPLSPGLGRGFCLVAGGLGERLGYPGCSAVIIAVQRHVGPSEALAKNHDIFFGEYFKDEDLFNYLPVKFWMQRSRC